jgi:hypothetical protein
MLDPVALLGTNTRVALARQLQRELVLIVEVVVVGAGCESCRRSIVAAARRRSRAEQEQMMLPDTGHGEGACGVARRHHR